MRSSLLKSSSSATTTSSSSINSSSAKCGVPHNSRPAPKASQGPVNGRAGGASAVIAQHTSTVLPRHVARAQHLDHEDGTAALPVVQQQQQLKPTQQQQEQQQQQQQHSGDGPPAAPLPGQDPGQATAVVDPSAQQPDAAAVAAAPDDTAAGHAAAVDAAAPPVNKYTYFYTHVHPQPLEPQPVQLPPPQPCMDPVRPFFNKAKYRPPSFLQYYAAPRGSTYNFLSFLGDADPNGGKFLAVGGQLDAFLESYFNTVALANRRMYLAECYQGQPFKLYQELDFPWTLDPQLVLDLIPRVVDILAGEVARVYADQLPPGVTPQPLISMRTIYKVHLNFPGITTMEAKAGTLRKAVINACRQQLSGQPPLDTLRTELALQEHWQEAQAVLVQLQQAAQQLSQMGQELPAEAAQLLQEHQQLLASAQDSSRAASHAAAPQQQTVPEQQQPSSQQEQQQQQPLSLEEQQQQLDWESIIDFPHGSLRLLGGCKGPWMDSDPEWVTEKSYGRVECVDGVWVRQPLSLASVLECSILLGEGELRVFEQTEEFLEVTYQGVQQREEVMAAKRVKRAAKRYLDAARARLEHPEQPPPRSKVALRMADKLQRQRDKERRRLEVQAQMERQAAERAEMERKKADALARLQAGPRPAPALTRPALSRPPPPPPQTPAPATPPPPGR